MSEHEEGQGGPAAAFDTAMTFDELETQIQDATKAAENQPTDLGSIKLDGEHVPENLRNKSAAEMVEYVKGLEKSLRISEEARAAQPKIEEPVAPPPPEPVAPPTPTVEQVREWMEKDPVATTAYLMQLAQQQAEARFEKRIAPLVGGAANSAETVAKERYKVEFELFGPQIRELVGKVPDRSALSNPGAWDDLISYVRGRPGNIEKYIERVNATREEPALHQIRQTQPQPPNLTSTRRAPAPSPQGGGELDPIKREIAKNLGMSEADYLKWSKVR